VFILVLTRYKYLINVIGVGSIELVNLMCLMKYLRLYLSYTFEKCVRAVFKCVSIVNNFLYIKVQRVTRESNWKINTLFLIKLWYNITN